MQVFGPNELLADVHQRNLCINCGACTELCPYFKSYKGSTGMLFSCNIEKGRCYAHCPKTEVDLEELSHTIFGKPYDTSPIGSYKTIRVAKAGPKMTDGNFQSGGTVSALITYAMQKGIIDAAVLTNQEKLVAESHLVTQSEDVVKFASSKYVAAPAVGMINRGQKEGLKKMGIVGTPCHMMAVAKMRANPMGVDDFQDPISMTIGLFCTWALDSKSLIKYVSSKVDIDTIKKMDIPPPPANILVIETRDGKEVKLPLDEIRQFIPNSCSICPDMTSEWADISVGVLEDQTDMNTLIIRTKRGEELVSKAEKDGFIVTEDMPEESLNHLMEAAQNKKKKALHLANEQGFLNSNAEGQRSVFRIKDSLLQKILS